MLDKLKKLMFIFILIIMVINVCSCFSKPNPDREKYIRYFDEIDQIIENNKLENQFMFGIPYKEYLELSSEEQKKLSIEWTDMYWKIMYEKFPEEVKKLNEDWEKQKKDDPLYNQILENNPDLKEQDLEAIKEDYKIR